MLFNTSYRTFRFLEYEISMKKEICLWNFAGKFSIRCRINVMNRLCSSNTLLSRWVRYGIKYRHPDQKLVYPYILSQRTLWKIVRVLVTGSRRFVTRLRNVWRLLHVTTLVWRKQRRPLLDLLTSCIRSRSVHGSQFKFCLLDAPLQMFDYKTSRSRSPPLPRRSLEMVLSLRQNDARRLSTPHFEYCTGFARWSGRQRRRKKTLPAWADVSSVTVARVKHTTLLHGRVSRLLSLGAIYCTV